MRGFIRKYIIPSFSNKSTASFSEKRPSSTETELRWIRWKKGRVQDRKAKFNEQKPTENAIDHCQPRCFMRKTNDIKNSMVLKNSRGIHGGGLNIRKTKRIRRVCNTELRGSCNKFFN